MKRFSEHYRIEQYLRNKSLKDIQPKTIKRDENVLSCFPVGLIILGKEYVKYENKLEYINKYACKLFGLKENTNFKELMNKFSEFVKLKHNNANKSKKTLKDMILNYASFNFELENFIPFESTYSKSIVLYIKINEIDCEKYIVIDKYDKYVEERQYIELNLIKTLNYQYLHTLYHELNNPLNALLAISGEKEKNNQFYMSDISIDKKPLIINKKTVKLKKINNITTYNFKKDKYSQIGLSSNKLGISPEILDYRIKKKSYVYENNNDDLNDKIPLLVNIIKIFIKNFILYLKTRSDNLIMLKNEFNIQNETSDIMNAVEVSEYERELTRHKSVKINLEYIFELYFEKFQCLFKYKEIECETNFEKLRHLFVITDEFNFIYYIREIYTYLYYIVPKKEGFVFDYKEDPNDNTIKMIIRKRIDGDTSKITDEQFENLFKDIKNKEKEKDNKSDMSQIIQTKEMTKEVLYSMSKKLNFALEIIDNYENNENSNNNHIYLCITMPIQKKDQNEEEDDFKDEDINEMVQKDTSYLEDKLKRQFPACETNEQKKSRKSSNSVNNYADLVNKDGKDFSESSIYIQKKEKMLKNNLKSNVVSSNKASDKSVNEKSKKGSISHNKPSNTFLNKCLKMTDKRKSDKDLVNKLVENNNNNKRKSHNLLNLNYYSKGNIKNNNLNHRSYKNVLYKDISQKRENDSQKPKLSGVFTKINNLGLSEELAFNDLSISNITSDLNKSKRDDKIHNNKILSKNKNQDENKNINNLFKFEMSSKAQDSTNINSKIKDINNNSKYKTSYIIADAIEGKNKNINININNNNIINIINDNSLPKNNFINNIPFNTNTENNTGGHLNLLTNKNNNRNKNKSSLITNTKIEQNNNSNLIKLPEIDKSHQKRFSQNISPKINPKDCMTFFGEKKDNISKEKKTTLVLNENISQNKKLFLEADKEREINAQKTTIKNTTNSNLANNIIISNSQLEKEGSESSDEYIISEEKDSEEEQISCNCLDVLIVDDEEFNVMASQKMMKNLGILTDAAYNGEECINLIKQKKDSNCSCNKNYYKIIFLDIVMPVLDGIKTAKKIQEMIDNKEINENTQIIFVSGNIDGKDLKESLLKINCVKECLQKPVRIDKYQKILEKYYKNN